MNHNIVVVSDLVELMYGCFLFFQSIWAGFVHLLGWKASNHWGHKLQLWDEATQPENVWEHPL